MTRSNTNSAADTDFTGTLKDRNVKITSSGLASLSVAEGGTRCDVTIEAEARAATRLEAAAEVLHSLYGTGKLGMPEGFAALREWSDAYKILMRVRWLLAQSPAFCPNCGVLRMSDTAFAEGDCLECRPIPSDETESQSGTAS